MRENLMSREGEGGNRWLHQTSTKEESKILKRRKKIPMSKVLKFLTLVTQLRNEK